MLWPTPHESPTGKQENKNHSSPLKQLELSHDVFRGNKDSTLAAVIKPSEQFEQCAEAVLNDIDEKSGVEVLTPSRSRVRFPNSWKSVYHYYETEYLPMVWLLIRLEVSLGRTADCEQIFSDSFRSLFNKDEITKATEPQLCSRRNGYFTFRKTTVLSVFLDRIIQTRRKQYSSWDYYDC
jgi:hypothetical protein